MDMDWTQQQRWQETLSGFEAVWARVTGGAAPARDVPAVAQPLSGTDRLRTLGRQEELAAAYDRALAGRFSRTAQSVLLRHAQSAACRSSRLRAEAFVLDGQRRPSSASCPRIGNALSGLREAMLRDEAAAAEYARAAGDVDPSLLRELFSLYSQERRQAAAEKRELILRCFR